MNVLTKWPVTKDAIEVFLKASGNKTYEGYTRFNTNAKATRLHNICIPKIMRKDTFQDKYKFKASIENRTDTVQFVEELVIPSMRMRMKAKRKSLMKKISETSI